MKKKKVFIIVAIIFFWVILLFPVKIGANDGGTIQYSAVLYTLTLKNAYYDEDGIIGKDVGTIVTILGIEVYNDVKFVPIDDYTNGNY